MKYAFLDAKSDRFKTWKVRTLVGMHTKHYNTPYPLTLPEDFTSNLEDFRLAKVRWQVRSGQPRRWDLGPLGTQDGTLSLWQLVGRPVGGSVEIKDVGFEHIPQTKFDGGVGKFAAECWLRFTEGPAKDANTLKTCLLLREVQCGDVVTALGDVVPVEGEFVAQYAASFLWRPLLLIPENLRVLDAEKGTKLGLGRNLSTVICELLEETYPGAGICALAIARRGDESKFVQLLQLRMYFFDMGEQAAKQRLVWKNATVRNVTSYTHRFPALESHGPTVDDYISHPQTKVGLHVSLLIWELTNHLETSFQQALSDAKMRIQGGHFEYWMTSKWVKLGRGWELATRGCGLKHTSMLGCHFRGMGWIMFRIPII